MFKITNAIKTLSITECQILTPWLFYSYKHSLSRALRTWIDKQTIPDVEGLGNNYLVHAAVQLRMNLLFRCPFEDQPKDLLVCA